jgi:hypothetical protein
MSEKFRTGKIAGEMGTVYRGDYCVFTMFFAVESLKDMKKEGLPDA